jgi:hypothetical protein
LHHYIFKAKSFFLENQATKMPGHALTSLLIGLVFLVLDFAAVSLAALEEAESNVFRWLGFGTAILLALFAYAYQRGILV